MTKEKAIEILDAMFDENDANHEIDFEEFYYERMEALNLAMESLKKEPEKIYIVNKDIKSICGYNAEELIIFADACRKQNISPEMMHDFCTNIQAIYSYVNDELKNKLIHELDDFVLYGSKK